MCSAAYCRAATRMGPWPDGGRAALQATSQAPRETGERREHEDDRLWSRRLGASAMTALASTNSLRPRLASSPSTAPSRAQILVAVDRAASSRAAAKAAIELAQASGSSLLFVSARRRPSSIWGAPFYQRRLSRETRRAQSALDAVVQLALDAGVDADMEIIEASPRNDLVDFAAARGARIILGSSRLRPASSAVISVLPPRSAGDAMRRPSAAHQSRGNRRRSA
jgi:nucleotide-binding universal stress UspA family protein